MNTSDTLHIGCNVSLRLVIDAINSYKHLAPYSDFKPWKSVWWIKEEGGWCHIWLALPKRANSSFLIWRGCLTCLSAVLVEIILRYFLKTLSLKFSGYMIDEACYTSRFHRSSQVAQRKNGEATILSWMWVHLVTLARRMYFFSSDYSMIFW